MVPAFPVNRRLKYLYGLKYAYYQRRGLTYWPDREPFYLRSLAWQIERRVRQTKADFLFSPGSLAIAALRIDVPKIFCADATFANVLEFYGSFQNCAEEFIRQGHEQERKALDNCTMAIFPSEWAAQTAMAYYGAACEKVHVIPFGANIEALPRDVILRAIEGRRFDRFHLLFVGRDWYRKGADVVLATCAHLHRLGFPITLDLVGIAEPPVPVPPYVTLHGLLSPSDAGQRQRLESLFCNAHVLFVPSRAENFGMVFCEAAAFGVPSVATATGGIPTIVREGITGAALPQDSLPETFAQTIGQLLSDPVRYRRLALSSRDEYEARLNWRTFAQRFFEHAQRIGLTV
ncbi:MAG: glycosyltransferase family 4 protein [Nitrococcus sp.]|nr:glycosyltransferase family 4 protein [Nitrococcus sp.]